MSTGRKTNNSQKSASHLQMQQDPSQNPGLTSVEARSSSLNQGFLGATSSNYNMATMDEIITSGKYLDEAFANLSTDEKLSLILTELYKMRSNLNTLQHSANAVKQQVDTHEQELRSADDVTSTKITEIEDKSQTNSNDILGLHETNSDLLERLSTAEGKINQNAMNVNWLKGTAERQHKQIASTQHRVTDLTARSMDHNFTISGLIETKAENCKMVVMDFFRDLMALRFDQDDVKVAHRLGYRSQHQRRPRLMVVKVSSKLKDLIIPNTNRLKNKTNNNGLAYFVNLQVPEAIAAERKAIQYEIKRIKDYNELVGAEGRKKQFTVANKKLYVDEKLHEQMVLPPRPLEIFASASDQEKMDKIDFAVSRPKTENKSQFIGLATKVENEEQVQLAYRKVRQMYPSYDHVMLGYRIRPNESEGYQDDGEHAAGMKIHAKITDMRCHGVAVFVVRNFGGIHIGSLRFDCISSVTESALERLIRDYPEVLTPRPWEQYRLDAEELLNGPRPPIGERLQNLADDQPQQVTPPFGESTT